MQEVGIDLSDKRPKRLVRELQVHADWAVTMGCGDACPYVPTTVEDWDIRDPAGRPTDEVRAICDIIQARVTDLISHKLDAIRSDRTAHQVRLAQLLPELARAFEGRRSDPEIRACADAVLDRFDDIPVRSYVLTLAARRTRECLSAEVREELTVGAP